MTTPASEPAEQWLLELMGQHDFAIPTPAYHELLGALSESSIATRGEPTEAHAATSYPKAAAEQLSDWTFQLEGDKAMIVSPESGPGFMTVHKDSKRLADRLLYGITAALSDAKTVIPGES